MAFSEALGPAVQEDQHSVTCEPCVAQHMAHSEGMSLPVVGHHCPGRAQSKASITPSCQRPATALGHEFVGGGGIVQEELDQRQGITITPRC